VTLAGQVNIRALTADFVVVHSVSLENRHAVIVEMKATSELHPLHQAQLLSYLKATRLRLGLFITFNVQVLKDGLRRIVR